MKTAADGRCALHAISQVMRGRDVSYPDDPLIASLKAFYPSIRSRIDHLYATGQFARDQFDVSNPQVFHEFIEKCVPWVTHVLVLRASQDRAGALSDSALALAAMRQGYQPPAVDAVRKRTAAVFIHHRGHWSAAVPAERACTRF